VIALLESISMGKEGTASKFRVLFATFEVFTAVKIQIEIWVVI
jgi:hypothetical protein